MLRISLTAPGASDAGRPASTPFPTETIVAMSQPLHSVSHERSSSSVPPSGEPELEVKCRNVRAIVFRSASEEAASYRVALLRHDAPFQLFPSELADYAFSLAELRDLRLVLDAAEAWIEVQRQRRSQPS